MLHKHFSQRFTNFSKDQKDIVQAGVELFYHWKYENAKPAERNKVAKYKMYSEKEGTTYQEKQKLFSEALVKQAIASAYLPEGLEFSKSVMMGHPNVKFTMFAIISEILDVVIPDTVLDNFYQFADVKSSGWGDNFVWSVPNNDLFVVSKLADGIRKGNRQRLVGTDVILTPVMREVTIAEDLYRVIAGKVNWGDWVNRVAQAIETQITIDIYNSIFNSYSALGTAYKANGAFAQTTFNNLVQLVEAANHGANAVAFGTKVALSKVVPDSQYLTFGLGQEYNGAGYLGNFQGTGLFKFDQRVTPNTDTLAISDQYLLIIATMVDKLVKIAFEGETMISQTDSKDSSDNSIDYTVKKKWDTKIITSAKYAMYQLA
ncbi:hypothetical protein BC351_00330 [Paenibacillus ferrarius]|uniref:Phage capsid protein n=1 Tax=Paenibacillus ferrarius TaxID=1469647 RepID=A0A1V4HT95_9BACL|nr:hypothetical protein [Paenibacillus ferrarius]OPH61723.1 hypothetical protein BC351_00330 [Paenibacillus ferrarius]